MRARSLCSAVLTLTAVFGPSTGVASGNADDLIGNATGRKIRISGNGETSRANNVITERKQATYSECRAHAATQNRCDPVVCGSPTDTAGAVPAIWVRQRPTGSTTWSDWRIVPTTCPDPLQERVDDAWARATLTAPPVTIIDGRGWTFVQIDTVTYTDGTLQTFTPTLGGDTVEIRATPLSYTWDFGDGSRPRTTTVPGGPYPNKTVTHRYTTLGTFTTTVTITWQAQFRMVGSTQWRQVNGQNTTTSTSAPVTTYEARSRLVEEPLPR